MGGEALERLVPGAGSVALFKDHEARYQFAGAFVKDKRVLDIACGCGIGTSYLLRAGARCCTGLDISPEAVGYARAHYPGPTFAFGDALKIPLEDESVDVVVSFETIEHVSDAERFLSECRRVLVPGGLFIGSTPHDPVYGRMYPVDNEFHLRDFSAEQFATMLSAQFRDVQLYAQRPVIFPVIVVACQLVRVPRALHITKPILKLIGRSDFYTLPTATEYSVPVADSGIRPYRPSWLRQPTVTIAAATKMFT